MNENLLLVLFAIANELHDLNNQVYELIFRKKYERVKELQPVFSELDKVKKKKQK